jgi:hypothetical protein
LLDHPIVGFRFFNAATFAAGFIKRVILWHGHIVSCGVTRFPGLWVLWAEDIPQLKAKMGSPVIDELIGGCSLTCAFPWDAMASDLDTSKISALNDSSSLTAWTSARMGRQTGFQVSSKSSA